MEGSEGESKDSRASRLPTDLIELDCYAENRRAFSGSVQGPAATFDFRQARPAVEVNLARTAPFRYPAGRERGPGPNHHRVRDPRPVSRAWPRRLAGLG